MTGFSKILETQQASELGAIGFLTKPFSSEELLSKLQIHLKPKSEEPPQESEDLNDLDHQFCKVDLENFVSEKGSDYGIYLRISKAKYIKIAHQGGKLSPDRIKTLKSKGIHYLYVRKEDFSKLVGFTLLLSKAISTSHEVKNEKRFRFLRYAGEVVLEQIAATGINEQTFRTSKEFVSTTIETISKDKDLEVTLQALSEHSDYLYSHSLAVSLISVLIAQEMGFNTPSVLFKVALGGLYHDIGKKEIPQEVLIKPRHLLKTEEVQLLESHVRRGQEFVESFRNIPSDVIQIIAEHHEDLLGQGYPRGLHGARIHPLSQIVAAADIFCEYIIKERPDATTLEPKAAIIKMQTSKGDSINRSAIMALHKLMAFVK